MEALLFLLGVFAFFMLVPLFIGLLMVYVMKSHKKGQEMWTRVAENFGLLYQPSGFVRPARMSGTFASVPLEVTTFSKRSKLNHDRRIMYVAVCAWIPSHHAPRMLIRREGLLQKASKVLHGELAVGDETLDKALLIKGADEQAVRTLLTHPPVKEVLLKAVRRYPSMKVEKNHLRVEFRAAGLDERVFSEHINVCAYIAKAIAHSADQLFGEPPQNAAPGEAAASAAPPKEDAEGWW